MFFILEKAPTHSSEPLYSSDSAPQVEAEPAVRWASELGHARAPVSRRLYEYVLALLTVSHPYSQKPTGNSKISYLRSWSRHLESTGVPLALLSDAKIVAPSKRRVLRILKKTQREFENEISRLFLSRWTVLRDRTDRTNTEGPFRGVFHEYASLPFFHTRKRTFKTGGGAGRVAGRPRAKAASDPQQRFIISVGVGRLGETLSGLGLFERVLESCRQSSAFELSFVPEKDTEIVGYAVDTEAGARRGRARRPPQRLFTRPRFREDALGGGGHSFNSNRKNREENVQTRMRFIEISSTRRKKGFKRKKIQIKSGDLRRGTAKLLHARGGLSKAQNKSFPKRRNKS